MGVETVRTLPSASGLPLTYVVHRTSEDSLAGYEFSPTAKPALATCIQGP